MASRGDIAPQKLQEERHNPGRAGGKCKKIIVHKPSECAGFYAQSFPSLQTSR